MVIEIVISPLYVAIKNIKNLSTEIHPRYVKSNDKFHVNALYVLPVQDDRCIYAKQLQQQVNNSAIKLEPIQ